MKTVPSDTSQKMKKYQLLLLNASLSYNFAADSLRLSDLSLSYRTSVGDSLSLSGNSSFSFYKFDPSARSRVNRFLVDLGEGLAQMTSFGVSVTLSLRGSQKSDFQGEGYEQLPLPPSGTAFGGTGRSFFGLREEENLISASRGI